jgi:hypothetical protein
MDRRRRPPTVPTRKGAGTQILSVHVYCETGDEEAAGFRYADVEDVRCAGG